MRPDSRFTWLLLAVTLLAWPAIGFWDDYLKLAKKNPKGAPSRLKFLVQIAVGLGVAAYLAVRSAQQPPSSRRSTFLTARNSSSSSAPSISCWRP